MWGSKAKRDHCVLRPLLVGLSLTEGPLQYFVVHDGAGLPVHHAVSYGLVSLAELAFALGRLNGSRAVKRKHLV